ncbi:MAG: class I SAM-dependent methyltransferase [Spirochaetes bacterium]|nr:class I SAM-dependent methyltransferase [Spirochaetota bacterium]MBU0954398.1 class I SAM-dependent methyltransferase [Spirochaetota bacterium]
MYEIISRDYEKLFPSDPARVDFARRLADEGPADSLSAGKKAADKMQSDGGVAILDIGCATGEFALALCAAGFQVTGWEPDSQLLAKARGLRTELPPGQQTRLLFEQKGMLDLESQAAYDQIYCMGNTLPHLQNAGRILQFLQKARQALKPGGRLVLQIINFARVLGKSIHHFPVVETEEIRFERSYTEISPESLSFTIRIFDKADGTDKTAATSLYPVTANELKNLLWQSGFGSVALYAGYTLEAAADASPHFLAVAE